MGGIYCINRPGTNSATIGYKIELNDWSGLPSGAIIQSWSGRIGNTWFSSSTTFTGTVQVSGLASGLSQTISAEVSCSYAYTYINDEDEKTTATGTTSTKSYSITVYTHPGSLPIGATNVQTDSNSIIKNVLTSDFINNRWIPHLNQVYRWWHQEDVIYPGTNQVYSSDTLTGLMVEEGQPVYAGWFNNCVRALNSVREPQYALSTVEANDIIYASTINRLNFNGPG